MQLTLAKTFQNCPSRNSDVLQSWLLAGTDVKNWGLITFAGYNVKNRGHVFTAVLYAPNIPTHTSDMRNTY